VVRVIDSGSRGKTNHTLSIRNMKPTNRNDDDLSPHAERLNDNFRVYGFTLSTDFTRVFFVLFYKFSLNTIVFDDWLIMDTVMDLCLKGHNVLLCGQAGTGKTTILKKIVDKLQPTRHIHICAATGISTLQFGGYLVLCLVTPHNFFI